ncbi:MAG: hypothetical protein KJ902_00540 [Candidatus Omnitrophica bacterium]|nr:hypothetical protein [Candidatus Omnitrophota bacterium]MBU4457209.1 hypothetical protein [Candidatus Omnitrophota bacterium]
MKKIIVLATLLMISFVIFAVSYGYAELTYIVSEEHEIVREDYSYLHVDEEIKTEVQFNRHCLKLRIYLENYGDERLEETRGLYLKLIATGYPEGPIILDDGTICPPWPPFNHIVIKDPDAFIPSVLPHSKELVREFSFNIMNLIKIREIIEPEPPFVPTTEDAADLSEGGADLDYIKMEPYYLVAGVRYLMTAKVGWNEFDESGDSFMGQITDAIEIPLLLRGYHDHERQWLRNTLIDIRGTVYSTNAIVEEIGSILQEFRSHFDYRFSQMSENIDTVIEKINEFRNYVRIKFYYTRRYLRLIYNCVR